MEIVTGFCKTLFLFKRRKRTACAVLLSFCIHGTIFVFLSVSSRPRGGERKLPEKNIVRIVAPPVLPQQGKVTVGRLAPPMKSDSKNGVERVRQKKNAVGGRNTAPSSTDRTESVKSSKPSVYGFFPGLETRERWRNDGASTSEGALRTTKTGGTPIAELAPLVLFSEYVKERISVPEVLNNVLYSGQGRAVLKRIEMEDRKVWKLAQVEGEPFLNAILYSAVSDCLENPDRLKPLEAYEKNQINIVLRYTNHTAMGVQERKLTHSIESHGIDFQFRDYNYNKEWKLFGATAPATMSFSLIGAAVYLFDKVKPPDFSKDPDLFRLKRSPGYTMQGLF